MSSRKKGTGYMTFRWAAPFLGARSGFAECWIELAEQAEAAGIHPDYVYTCTGSGGTLAGLAAGRTLIGSDRTVLTGIAVGKKDPETYGKEVRLLADDVLMLLGEKKLTKPDVFQILYDYVGAGYEKPFGLANDDIRLLARTEGIFLDPVYSGKAFPRHDGRNPQKKCAPREHRGVSSHRRRDSGSSRNLKLLGIFLKKSRIFA